MQKNSINNKLLLDNLNRYLMKTQKIIYWMHARIKILMMQIIIIIKINYYSNINKVIVKIT